MPLPRELDGQLPERPEGTTHVSNDPDEVRGFLEEQTASRELRIAKLVPYLKALRLVADEIDGYLVYRAPRCSVYIEARNGYCDRGAYKVLAESHDVTLTIDVHDGFPRYYFEPLCCALELKAWLVARGELPQ